MKSEQYNLYRIRTILSDECRHAEYGIPSGPHAESGNPRINSRNSSNVNTDLKFGIFRIYRERNARALCLSMVFSSATFLQCKINISTALSGSDITFPAPSRDPCNDTFRPLVAQQSISRLAADLRWFLAYSGSPCVFSISACNFPKDSRIREVMCQFKPSMLQMNFVQVEAAIRMNSSNAGYATNATTACFTWPWKSAQAHSNDQ